jgi:N-acetylmuramoyl-L-alanine amidase
MLKTIRALAAIATGVFALVFAAPALAEDIEASSSAAVAAPAVAAPVAATPAAVAYASPAPSSGLASAPAAPAPAAASSGLAALLSELVRSQPEPVPGNEDQECIAAAVYFEARGEPIEGQLAVAEVVLNRAASGKYPTSVCAVVKQAAQFSFVKKGTIPPIAKATEAWRKAVAIARVAYQRLAQQIGSDVLWYHADYVSPSWGRRLSRAVQIGAHIFYRIEG